MAVLQHSGQGVASIRWIVVCLLGSGRDTVYMYLEWVPIISAGVIFRFLVCLLVSGESLIGVVGGLDWC